MPKPWGSCSQRWLIHIVRLHARSRPAHPKFWSPAWAASMDTFAKQMKPTSPVALQKFGTNSYQTLQGMKAHYREPSTLNILRSCTTNKSRLGQQNKVLGQVLHANANKRRSEPPSWDLCPARGIWCTFHIVRSQQRACQQMPLHENDESWFLLSNRFQWDPTY